VRDALGKAESGGRNPTAQNVQITDSQRRGNLTIRETLSSTASAKFAKRRFRAQITGLTDAARFDLLHKE